MSSIIDKKRAIYIKRSGEEKTSVASTMNTTEQQHYNVHTYFLSASVLFVVLELILYTIVTYKIYMKSKNNTEPMHVFLLNLISVITFCITFQLMHIVHSLVGIGNVCLYYYFGVFIHISFNTDMTLMQIDRFLAVFWNIKYKSRVTTEMALRSCVASKVFAMILTILIAKLDPTYRECSSSYRMWFLKSSTIHFDAYPKLIVACAMVVVSIYEIIILEKLKKKIHPQITLPTLQSLPCVSGAVQEQENNQQAINNEALSKIKRKDKDPNMFYEVKFEPENPRDTKNLPKIFDAPIPPVRRMHMRALSTPLNKQTNKHRRESDVEEITFQCFNSEIFKEAKAALKMNLLTSVFFLLFLPLRILAIIYHNCNEVSGDCSYFLQLSGILIPSRILSALLYPILILKQI